MNVVLGSRALDRGALRVDVAANPVRISVHRAGRPLVVDLRLWVADGRAADRFLPLTEGVMPHEDLGPRRELRDPGAVGVTLHGEHHVEIAFAPPDGPLRVGAEWRGTLGERFAGLGARHGLDLDQSGRTVHLGADRRYTGPDCPGEMLELGGIPQGDYAPAPWLLSSAGYAAWLETDGPGVRADLATGRTGLSARAAAGPLRLHLL
jgi:hypothetical protein